MRKFLLSLLLLVVFSPLALRADEVIVGTADGTTPTAVVPFRNTSDATYRLFEKFTETYRLKPYRTEWAIYDEETGVAGTL